MPSPTGRNDAPKRAFAVANLTISRVTEMLEHWVSKETGRNAKPEMVSVNGIELRQQFECGGLAIMRKRKQYRERVASQRNIPTPPESKATACFESSARELGRSLNESGRES